MGADAALAQSQLLGALQQQLLRQGIPPGGFRLLTLELTAGAVAQTQEFTAIAEAVLPSLGQGFQPPQRPQPPAVQPGSNQGHLLVKGIQQPLKLGLGESPPQQLGALTQ
jgi:hypothetical protein